MKKTTIDVTQEDINQAVKARSFTDHNVCRHCIVAIAMSRAFGTQISVGHIDWWRRGTYESHELPKSAQAVTLLNSSNWRNVKPFSFKVETPHWATPP